MARFAPNAPVVESLESRRLMAATITGAVMRDLTGNGLTADDTTGLAGVVVKLYKDRNANGVLDAADGAALGTRTSAAITGAFSFGGLGKGKFLLQETPGPNQVRTGPFLTDTIAVDVAKKKGVFGGNLFANYVKDFDRSAVSGITYTVNGGAPISTMDGNVHSGDTVPVNFTVAAGKTVTVSFVSYTAPEPFSTAENLQFQELFQADTGTFTGGTHSLTVKVPDCYFQLDFVGGLPIDPFGPAGSDILYARQGRRIAFVNGGTEECGCEEIPPCEEEPPCGEEAPCEEEPPCEEKPPCEEQTGNEGLTPGFWKNHTEQWANYTTSQTLESVFDVPDALGLDNATLLEALNFGGGAGAKGAAQNLFRHAVAAILNAQHPLVEYPITAATIVTRVNAALATNDASSMASLKNELDTMNNLGGGIDAHGREI